MRLSSRHAPLAYGIIQSALTTGIATAIATSKVAGVNLTSVGPWLSSWLLSWGALLPIVVIFSPMIKRLVDQMVDQRPPGAR